MSRREQLLKISCKSCTERGTLLGVMLEHNTKLCTARCMEWEGRRGGYPTTCRRREQLLLSIRLRVGLLKRRPPAFYGRGTAAATLSCPTIVFLPY